VVERLRNTIDSGKGKSDEETVSGDGQEHLDGGENKKQKEGACAAIITQRYLEKWGNPIRRRQGQGLISVCTGGETTESSLEGSSRGLNDEQCFSRTISRGNINKKGGKAAVLGLRKKAELVGSSLGGVFSHHASDVGYTGSWE